MTYAAEVAQDLLRQGVPVRLRVRGGSMFPALRAGRVVILLPISCASELVVGDVAFVTCAGRAMLHRVVRPWPELRTKGDALGYLDPPPSDVWGCAQGFGGRHGAWIARASLRALPVQGKLARLHARLRGRG